MAAPIVMLSYLDDATVAHAGDPISGGKEAKPRATAAENNSLAPLISNNSSIQQRPAPQRQGSKDELFKVSVPVVSSGKLKAVWMPESDYMKYFCERRPGRLCRDRTREDVDSRRVGREVWKVQGR
jgi:hypothetical protein